MKTVFLIFYLLGAYFLYAQNPLVVSAYNYLKQGRLDKALESIEPTISHPQTMNQPKTWLYRGNIYLAIALSKEEKYNKLVVNPLDSAFISYSKCIQLDPEFAFPTVNPPSPKMGLQYIAEEYYNKGVELYNGRNYTEAMKFFEKSKKTNAIIQNQRDTLSTYLISLCALNLKDTALAIKNLNELTLKMKFKNLQPYLILSSIYLEKNDTINAKKIINLGRNLFPDSLPMLITEINYYLKSNNIAKAQDILQKAIEKDPKNPTLYFAIGANYGKLLSNIQNEQDKNKFIEEAIKAYEKALELKPDYYDVLYNLGALYHNLGAEAYELANNLPVNASEEEFENARKKYINYWEKAIPYLEKAYQINPNDFQLVDTLYRLYSKLNMVDKASKMKQIRDSMKN
ncbi:MAG: tetratricopeptide repeat protein [Bacteroidales bacterium]|nr:tetratricopeptide repeat protein [Bacteroidales bacterium]